MRLAYFGPSPTSIHVAAGWGRGQDKRDRSRTKGNSLRAVEKERRTSWRREWSGKVRRKREKKGDLAAGSKSKAGLQDPQWNRRNPALVPKRRQYNEAFAYGGLAPGLSR
jgi:hypothetical protein